MGRGDERLWPRRTTENGAASHKVLRSGKKECKCPWFINQDQDPRESTEKRESRGRAEGNRRTRMTTERTENTRTWGGEARKEKGHCGGEGVKAQQDKNNSEINVNIPFKLKIFTIIKTSPIKTLDNAPEKNLQVSLKGTKLEKKHCKILFAKYFTAAWLYNNELCLSTLDFSLGLRIIKQVYFKTNTKFQQHIHMLENVNPLSF